MRLCETCRFLKRIPPEAHGQCRRYAPRPGGREMAVWAPLVDLTYWCGEWEPRESTRPPADRLTGTSDDLDMDP